MYILIPLLIIIGVIGYIVAVNYDRFGQQTKKDRRKHKNDERQNADKNK